MICFEAFVLVCGIVHQYRQTVLLHKQEELVSRLESFADAYNERQ